MLGWLFRRQQPAPAPAPPPTRVPSPGLPVRNRIRNRRQLTPEQIRRLQRLSAQNRDNIEIGSDDLTDLLSLLMLHEMLTTDPGVEIGFCNSYFDLQTNGEWDRIASGEITPEELEIRDQTVPDPEPNPDAPGAEAEPADANAAVEPDVTEVAPETAPIVDYSRDDVMDTGGSYSGGGGGGYSDDSTTRNSGFGGSSYDSGGGGYDSGGGGYDSGGGDFGGGD